jgi:hypothetical protein
MLGAGALVVAALLACSPDRSPDVPPGTPSCEESCEAAWPCGGTLENDLDACIANCDDENYGTYRVCVAETECDLMYECKASAPGEIGVGDTDQ